MTTNGDMIPVPRSVLQASIDRLRELDSEEDAEAQALSDWETRHDHPGVLSDPFPQEAA